ncbi:hypothetical protein P691DRAFT_677327 [Macrolepiota fuliginosa MF-IS2]|uniref:Uncharacterized protein n=1 Tax=Macrolepiota fuliginosa MF-IS2 TaxID=1400762 RepID=A0A9P5X6H4_9AGAR|nr:hypothetical protein P691DRAFT_677327 [Macrolepiota fuliginosa MF-IS2]
MVTKELVDGLDVVGELELGGGCEDCVFRKMHAQPYNEEVMHERETLEQVHMDLWGPSPV